MFNILSYNHDHVTDAVTIRLVFQTHKDGEIHQHSPTFTSKSNADAWLNQLKKQYLTIRVEKFLFHKKHIHESGQGHRSKSEKLQKLARLFSYLDYSCNKANLFDACRWLLNEQETFYAVLPAQTNQSYESSKEALEEILNFARENTKHLQKKAS